MLLNEKLLIKLSTKNKFSQNLKRNRRDYYRKNKKSKMIQKLKEKKLELIILDLEKNLRYK